MIIGIDPDTFKNGIAIVDKKEIILKNLLFFDLFAFLEKNKPQIKEVIVEAGWLNLKSNFHYFGSISGINSKIGLKVGANHEVGRKILEMLEFLNINYRIEKPKSKKLNSKEFRKLTGYKGRTNQDVRDAFMLIYNFSEYFKND